MEKVFRIILIIIIIFIILLLIGYLVIKFIWHKMLTTPMAPENYISEVVTMKGLESNYMAKGNHDVAYYEIDYPEDKDIKKIEIWYPEEMNTNNKQYPIILFVNGTGVGASRYTPVFEHMASWGFIAIGNEDPSTFSGIKIDKTLSWLLEANEDYNSIFYKHIDINNIGIIGHSQGGVGVFNVINNTKHKDIYKCAISLSPTQMDLAQQLKIPYDPSFTNIPIMILAGDTNDVISNEGLNDVFNKINDNVIIARRKNTNHGQMLYSADGYVTAWFMWQLQYDKIAANAFMGNDIELLNNPNWIDIKIKVSE